MLDSTSTRKRVSHVVGVAATISLFAIPAVLFAPGCQGHQCESDGFHDYGQGPGEGDFADPEHNVWESTPNDDPAHRWLPFTPYRTWVFHLPFNGRHIASVQTWISADPDPNTPGKNYTVASGNLATVGDSPDENQIYVTNATCAPAYLRVVVTAYPPETGDPGSSDAGANADLDAGTNDDLDADNGDD